MEKKEMKEKEKEKISHMCESIGHRPLRGRCPKVVRIAPSSNIIVKHFLLTCVQFVKLMEKTKVTTVLTFVISTTRIDENEEMFGTIWKSIKRAL